MARKPRSEAGAQVESDLRYWGYHVGKQFAADGYPEDNPILALLSRYSSEFPCLLTGLVRQAPLLADTFRHRFPPGEGSFPLVDALTVLRQA